jgi:hypothetical protein
LRALARLFPDEMRGDFARVARAAMFPNKNSLPRSQRQPAFVKRDACLLPVLTPPMPRLTFAP